MKQKINFSNYNFESATVTLGGLASESVDFYCFVIALVDLSCQLDS